MRIKAILVLIVAILFAASPFISGEFGGFDPDRFPIPQIDPPVVPAGYAFSIWGLIYLLLIAHGAFGLLKRSADPQWHQTRTPLFFSLAVGSIWIPVAIASPIWATILIWIMLITALITLFQISTSKDRFVLKTPIALYAGWLTAASFVSLSLVGAGFGFFAGQLVWAWVGLIAASLFAASIQVRLAGTPEYGLAVAWALIAVAVRNWETQVPLAVFALVGVVGITVLAFRSARQAQA